MLDEDDYMLLQDNNITGISRPKPVCFFSHSLLSCPNFLGPVYEECSFCLLAGKQV